MFIFKATQLRGPAYPASTPYTSPDGTRHLGTPMDLLEEVAEPSPPADYSDKLYYRTEQDEAPYVVYTRKSDVQIAQQENAERLAKIAALEEQQRRDMARYDRESMLAKIEQEALTAYGLTPDQLYAMGQAPDADTAVKNYVKLKTLDNEIKAARSGLVAVPVEEPLA
jgi:hypothetical protein